MTIERTNRKKPDQFIERRIVTGMILSSKFLQKISGIYEPTLLVSREARVIAGWCLDYFNKYSKAPKRHIEDIYTRKLKVGLGDYSEGIEHILQSLNDEYSRKDLNIPYLLDETIQHFNRQRLEHLANKITSSNGDLGEAITAVRKFEPISTIAGSDIESQIEATVLDADKFVRLDFPKLKRYLRPWLAAESLNMIHGWRERGKTWLGLIIAIGLTRRIQNAQLNVGPWEFSCKAGVLYVDGEMPCAELQKRYKRLTRHLPPMSKKCPLTILSANHFAKQLEGKSITIATAEWREALYQFIKKHRRKYRVLMLDNLSALTAGVIENTKEEWDPINQWLLRLRHLGLTTILFHHESKGGKQRGTSGREDALDCVIRVTKPEGWTDEDGAWMKITFEKARHLTGEERKAFCIQIEEHPDGGLRWSERKEEAATAEKQNRMIVDIMQGRSNKDIAKEFGCVPGYVSQVKNKAKDRGLIDRKGRPTEAGIEMMRKYDGASLGSK
jgi:hypothetical protein